MISQFRAISPSRFVDDVECVFSVLLAIALAHLSGAANISWAAFAGYMVMRGHADETLLRGVLRVLGTMVGGFAALTLGVWASVNEIIAALVLLLVGTGSLYTASTARRAYAWLFVGLTYVMASLEHLAHPQISMQVFVATRVLETGVGTFACLIVSLASALTIRQRWPASRPPPAQIHGWRPDVFAHAAQGGLALLFLTLAMTQLSIPGPAQAAVTIMAAMLIPVDAMESDGLRSVSVRLFHRMLGCVAGGVYSAVFLLLAHGSAILPLIATAVGVAIGRHVENGPPAWRYVGMQFALAVLVTLVPDNYARAAATPAWERLAGIFIGIAALAPILLAGRAVALVSRRRRKPVAVKSASFDVGPME